MSASVEMNLYVSEQLNRQLVNITQDVSIRCVKILAEKYGFNEEDAILLLGLSKLKIERKQGEKMKNGKTAKAVVLKPKYPMPFTGHCEEKNCQALRQNSGLYTQCINEKKKGNEYCKSCLNQMQKVGADKPEYGTIKDRMDQGEEFADPKGRKPTNYAKIMKKYKLTREMVLEEAKKFNIEIDEKHFELPEVTKRGRPSNKSESPKEKGAKGRPKKTKKVVTIEGEDTEDLFETLVSNANLEVNTEKKKSKSEEEKEAERKAKEEEKAAKEAKRKLEKEEKAKKEAELKAEKEAKKKAEEEAKKAKKEAEEAEKKAKKEAAEKAKAEKEAKLAAEKAEKEAKKAEKTAKKPVEKKVEQKVEVAVEEEKDIVKSFKYNDITYYKSKSTGILYDYHEMKNNRVQVVVGKWHEATNTIELYEPEEHEEEYDD